MILALHHNFLLGCALGCMTRKCFDCVVCAFTVLACCTFHFCFLSWFRMTSLYKFMSGLNALFFAQLGSTAIRRGSRW